MNAHLNFIAKLFVFFWDTKCKVMPETTIRDSDLLHLKV